MSAQFKIGDPVEWTSSNVKKVGEVVAIVPTEQLPRHVGYPKAGGGGMYRFHESYIVRASPRDWQGVIQKRKADYWPRVALLRLQGEVS